MRGQYIHYTDSDVKVITFKHPKEITMLPDGSHWIHMPLTPEMNKIEAFHEIQRAFHMDRLIWEDIVKGDHLPKLEYSHHRLFMVLQAMTYDASKNQFVKDQISILYDNHCFYTFTDASYEPFQIVVDKLKSNRNDIRTKGPTYLLYQLIAAIVNLHFSLFETIEEKMDTIEAQVMRHVKGTAVHDLYNMRKEIMKAKSAIVPLKDIIKTLAYDTNFIPEDNKAVFLDLNDRLIEINESLAYYRELVNALYDMHLSNTSNRMNRIMTTLTVYSAIFIPLTFLAGIYGMNFKYMPELNQVWAYPVFLLVCFVIAVSMLSYFKRKKWL